VLRFLNDDESQHAHFVKNRWIFSTAKGCSFCLGTSRSGIRQETHPSRQRLCCDVSYVGTLRAFLFAWWWIFANIVICNGMAFSDRCMTHYVIILRSTYIWVSTKRLFRLWIRLKRFVMFQYTSCTAYSYQWYTLTRKSTKRPMSNVYGLNILNGWFQSLRRCICFTVFRFARLYHFEGSELLRVLFLDEILDTWSFHKSE
jgi:hypothetical protein